MPSDERQISNIRPDSRQKRRMFVAATDRGPLVVARRAEAPVFEKYNIARQQRAQRATGYIQKRVFLFSVQVR